MLEDIEQIRALPLDLKSKYIVELRKQGYTYKQIAKLLRVSTRDIARVLKKEFRKDEIEELKERVGRLEKFQNYVRKFGDYYKRRCRYFDGNVCRIYGVNPIPETCAICRLFERKLEIR